MTKTTQKKEFDYKAFNAFKKTPKYWGLFDFTNSKHKYILSLLRQMGWETSPELTGRSLADVERFGAWLQSNKAPVQKPLKKQSPEETSKTISALENMAAQKYK